MRKSERFRKPTGTEQVSRKFIGNLTRQARRGGPGAVSECAFGPHAALAKNPEMLMYNMYTPLSELFAALPADQIHHSDSPPEHSATAPGENKKN